MLSKLSSFPVLLKVHSDLNSFKRLWRDGLVNYRPVPNMKFHTHEEIALSFLPPPRGSQGGPVGERSWADSHSPYTGTAKLPPKYQPQDWGIKSSFLWKVWWHLHMVPKNIYMFADKLLAMKVEKHKSKV